MVSQTLLRSISSRLFRQKSSSSPASSISTLISKSIQKSTKSYQSTNHLANTAPAVTSCSILHRFKSTAASSTDYEHEDDEDKHESETFLTGSSSLYAEQMYENYKQDPNSVHETWRKYFDDLDSGKEYDEQAFNRPTVVTSNRAATTGDANQSHLAVSCCFFVLFCFGDLIFSNK